ncbi:glutamate receptor ionotropic, delta-2-like [Centruroides sculpturatus]|uniref:glutamate receptor ionotropic, delta-2-like n=1 Tax=Centruroides sculpturatus TaxID=218467 RepID=UPI000C6D9BD7|nr:glutamate receptor ionotropic, delta-2-like [Centruroides sculpturatus]
MPKKRSNWSSLLQPFSIQIWLMIFVTSLIFGFVVHKIINLEHVELFSLLRRNFFWYLFGTFVYQGGDISYVRRLRSRFLIAIWLISIIVLVCSYTATLTSNMSSPVIESLPTTTEELAIAIQNGEYSCGTVYKSLINKDLMLSPVSSIRIIGEHIQKNKHFFDEDISWKKTTTSHFALISTSKAIKKLYGIHGTNKFRVSKDSLLKYDLAYAFRKDFPHRKQFSKIITRLFDAGIIDKPNSNNQEDYRKEKSDVEPLMLNDVASPFALLFIGYFLSFCCFIVEIFVGKIKPTNNVGKENV